MKNGKYDFALELCLHVILKMEMASNGKWKASELYIIELGVILDWFELILNYRTLVILELVHVTPKLRRFIVLDIW